MLVRVTSFAREMAKTMPAHCNQSSAPPAMAHAKVRVPRADKGALKRPRSKSEYTAIEPKVIGANRVIPIPPTQFLSKISEVANDRALKPP